MRGTPGLAQPKVVVHYMLPSLDGYIDAKNLRFLPEIILIKKLCNRNEREVHLTTSNKKIYSQTVLSLDPYLQAKILRY